MRMLWLTLLLGSVVWAEQQHFHQSNATTWHEARLYCQECFKDLTTITSRNVHNIVQNLISDCWVGLRRSLNGSIPWSRWSNGDPVTYQNWYPGHPVPKIETCTPNITIINSTTAPTMNNTEDQCPLVMEILTCINMTYDDLQNITASLVKPPPPTVNITSNNTCDTEAEKYIEDSCLALLSFGMWKEKLCNESLQFICYDERFYGEINMTNVNKSDGHLAWSPAPGNITHYRVEVTGDNGSLICNETKRLKNLVNLTPGTRYNVQVYPVKCGRDLNPQNISFYTSPSDVFNLSVTNVTNISITLRWNHHGNCDFFLIKGAPDPHKINKTETVIQNLTPGANYTFTVFAVVNETTESVHASVSTYTMPSPVQNLTSADNSHTVITAYWNEPKGYFSSYRICLDEITSCSNCRQYNNSKTSVSYDNKTPGKTYFLCVTALTDNNSLSGETVQIQAYTRPNEVTLTLNSHATWIDATWEVDGCYKEFYVKIEAPGMFKNVSTAASNYSFKDLKAAVQYTVTVITLSEKLGLTSDPVQKSIYTLPNPPSQLQATALNQSSISLTWLVPTSSEGVNITYNVKCFSVYWNKTTITNTTENVTITGLSSGTQYVCSVCVLAGNLPSDAVNIATYTVPNRLTLTFAMLCTSEISLHCTNSLVQNNTLKELLKFIENKLAGIYWKLKMIDRK